VLKCDQTGPGNILVVSIKNWKIRGGETLENNRAGIERPPLSSNGTSVEGAVYCVDEEERSLTSELSAAKRVAISKEGK